MHSRTRLIRRCHCNCIASQNSSRSLSLVIACYPSTFLGTRLLLVGRVQFCLPGCLCSSRRIYRKSQVLGQRKRTQWSLVCWSISWCDLGHSESLRPCSTRHSCSLRRRMDIPPSTSHCSRGNRFRHHIQQRGLDPIEWTSSHNRHCCRTAWSLRD